MLKIRVEVDEVSDIDEKGRDMDKDEEGIEEKERLAGGEEEASRSRSWAGYSAHSLVPSTAGFER
ncbi:hypothetical protein E2C01_033314 [Portunus trituberculatus]|uniref:Uncharacterized protein n=1 Tax=Portunus trituberculatus TaxID=210409 RepID=A0A5B7F244_PORTR|nr:hypothetical protein [Portunus trituberculatus]